ncbi:unnamed protein product [Notodromas monacha]|uniref:EGF-like domain-containing protein n=1 Tax=Notodromas monacha TaxID=399045 RepID=A0A7R9BKD6_9CRUS|nr:unnamed protein product [Notodromas monacha]CAG0915584.1 unnamed protein product [Notodromas monacha]
MADFHTEAVASFEKSPAAGLRVASPKPGAWFAVAYLPAWDERVNLQGFSHKCRYSIGVVAHWVRSEEIKTLVLGQNHQLETTSSFRRYRFYVDGGVASVKLIFDGCRAVNGSERRLADVSSCLTNMVLVPEAPPFDAASEASAVLLGDLGFGAGQVIKEVSTGIRHDGSHYYLGVTSPGKVNFSVRIEPGTVCDTGGNLRNCPNWVKLTRVSRSVDFEADFFVEDADDEINQVMLKEDRPVLLTFVVLSYVDIGGSLHIRISPDFSSNSSAEVVTETPSQVTLVKAFLDTATILQSVPGNRSPNLTASFTKKTDFLSIPFPRAGSYSLYLTLECFNSQSRAAEVCREADNGNGIPIQVDVMTRMCAVPDWDGERRLCGRRGTCIELHRRRWFFSTCECYPGYTGWNCSQDVNVGWTFSSQEMLSPGRAMFILTLSNAAFIPVIVLAVRRRLWTPAGVYAAMAAFSVAYHVCDETSNASEPALGYELCIVWFEVLAFLDFLGSSAGIWVTVTSLADVSPGVESALMVVGVLFLAGGVRYSRTGLVPIFLPLLLGAAIAVGTNARTFWRKRKVEVEWRLVVIGASIALAGFCLYAFVETKLNYPVVHSVWHMVIALALVFLLPRFPRHEPNLSRDSVRYSGTELMLVTNHSEMDDDAWLIDGAERTAES